MIVRVERYLLKVVNIYWRVSSLLADYRCEYYCTAYLYCSYLKFFDSIISMNSDLFLIFKTKFFRDCIATIEYFI
jgi:hypothetical protein